MQNFIAGIWNIVGAPTLGFLGGGLFLYIVVFLANHLL